MYDRLCVNPFFNFTIHVHFRKLTCSTTPFSAEKVGWKTFSGVLKDVPIYAEKVVDQQKIVRACQRWTGCSPAAPVQAKLQPLFQPNRQQSGYLIWRTARHLQSIHFLSLCNTYIFHYCFCWLPWFEKILPERNSPPWWQGFLETKRWILQRRQLAPKCPCHHPLLSRPCRSSLLRPVLLVRLVCGCVAVAPTVARTTYVKARTITWIYWLCDSPQWATEHRWKNRSWSLEYETNEKYPENTSRALS